MVQNQRPEMCPNKTERLECIPILHVRGSYFSVGKSIGKIFKSMIQEMLESWPYFNDSLWKKYLEPFGKERFEKSLSLCKQRFPNYIEEIEGMSVGSEVPFEKLFLLNIDSIINDDVDTQGRGETGCTSIICNKAEVILGHTEDAMCEILNNVYIVDAEIVDECGNSLEKFTTFSYAGHLMGYTMGYNSHGMVYSVNTLFPQKIDYNGSPRAFVARALLAAKDVDQLIDILKDNGAGISDGMSLNVNFAKGKDSRTFYNIEVHPKYSSDSTESCVDVLPVGHGQSSLHCNKYLRFEATEHSVPVQVSTTRQVTIENYNSDPSCLHDIKFLLSDQSDQEFPVYICDQIQTRLSHIKTVAVGVFDLLKKTWSIYLGKPIESDPVAVLPLNF